MMMMVLHFSFGDFQDSLLLQEIPSIVEAHNLSCHHRPRLPQTICPNRLLVYLDSVHVRNPEILGEIVGPGQWGLSSESEEGAHQASNNGDITEDELASLLDELLGNLPETGAPMPPMVDVDIAPGITIVPFDTPQSVARFVQRGIGLEHPDYFTAMVMNHALGGGSFESRLTDEVRAKRGLTYGVYSYLAGKDLGDVYIGGVSSSNDRIAEAIDVIRDEWRKAATDGFSEEEIENAKTFLTGAYPLRFDGNGRIANIMVGMQLMGLPIDYITTRNDRVEAVTVDGVNRVAAELLDPDGLHFVVVGMPEGLQNTPAN